jgi:hydrogenase maturation protein HypF
MQANTNANNASFQSDLNKENRISLLIEIYGQVQGVGLRPWLFRLAHTRDLKGTIGNSLTCAFAHLEGPESAIEAFLNDLKSKPPSPAIVRDIKVRATQWHGKNSLTFESTSNFVESAMASLNDHQRDPKNDYQRDSTRNNTRETELKSSAIWSAPPDLATCKLCWSEYLNPVSRYHLYPFISCLACGPRWSILRSLPFNRENTTYSEFSLCVQCREEYQNSENRRFHSQTISCATCGPKIQLLSCPQMSSIDALNAVADGLAQGQVGAIKGLGGFQLVTSALLPQAIIRLREIKRRPDQCFAVMFRDEKTFIEFGGTTEQWSQLQTSHASIHSMKNIGLPTQKLLAPDLHELGVMFPTTPLHYAILERIKVAVVTSANASGFPIPATLKELKQMNDQWFSLDFILDHNREIAHPIDDSVIRGSTVLRAARGLSPKLRPLNLWQQRPTTIEQKGPIQHVLALGADLKNSCAFSGLEYTVELPYAGKLDTIEAAEVVKSRLRKSLSVFNFKPEVILEDPHPQSLTSQILPDEFQNCTKILKVPHHLAHAYSALESMNEYRNVLFLSFDGTGYDSPESSSTAGGEGYIWRNGKLEKVLSFFEQPIIGGDLAVREPWRLAAISLLKQGWNTSKILQSLESWDTSNLPRSDQRMETLEVLKSVLQLRLETPKTTSAGRWFDAVASILDFGFRSQTYEAQAPIRLESLAQSTQPSTQNFSRRQRLGHILNEPAVRLEFDPAKYLVSDTNGTILINGGEILTLIAEYKVAFKQSLSATDTSSRSDAQTALCYFAHDCLAATITHAANLLSVREIAISGGVFQNELLKDLLKAHLKGKNIGLVCASSLVNDQCIAAGQLAWHRSQQRGVECPNETKFVLENKELD